MSRYWWLWWWYCSYSISSWWVNIIIITLMNFIDTWYALLKRWTLLYWWYCCYTQQQKAGYHWYGRHYCAFLCCLSLQRLGRVHEDICYVLWKMIVAVRSTIEVIGRLREERRGEGSPQMLTRGILFQRPRCIWDGLFYLTSYFNRVLYKFKYAQASKGDKNSKLNLTMAISPAITYAANTTTNQ